MKIKAKLDHDNVKQQQPLKHPKALSFSATPHPLDILDHKRLDIEIDYFINIRASGENIAKYLWDELVTVIPKPAYLYHIRLWETSENFFDYKG